MLAGATVKNNFVLLHKKQDNNNNNTMLQDLGIDHVVAFGIACNVLCDEDLPLIVTWRNTDEIRFFMEDDRLISKTTINFWFASIKNKNTHVPYIVKFNDIPCGYM